jgi:rubrerythrin
MSNQTDDFNPKASFEKLQASIEQPDKFAKIFCDAAKTQKTIDDALKEVLRSLIKHDNDTRNSLKDILREVEKEELKSYLKKIGFGGWTILVVIITAILQSVSRKFLG